MKAAFSIATLCAATSAVLIQSEPLLGDGPIRTQDAPVLDATAPTFDAPITHTVGPPLDAPILDATAPIRIPRPIKAIDALMVAAATPMCVAPSPDVELDCPPGTLYIDTPKCGQIYKAELDKVSYKENFEDGSVEITELAT